MQTRFRNRPALLGLALLALGALALAPSAGAHDRGHDRAYDGPGYPGYGPPPWAFQSYGPPSEYGAGYAGGPGHLCGRGAYLVERMDRFMDHFIDMTEAQAAAWKGVMDAADAAREKAEEACEDRDDWKGTAPERLARMEEMMAAGVEAMHTVRPKFEAFYATLTERQRQALDDLMVHRHGRWH